MGIEHHPDPHERAHRQLDPQEHRSGRDHRVSDTSSIKALILALSVAVGGGAVGVGASIGLALAENLVGCDPDPTTTYTYVYGDNVLTLHAGDRVKINDGIRAGDVYQYLGPTYTVPFDYPEHGGHVDRHEGQARQGRRDRRGLRVPRLGHPGQPEPRRAGLHRHQEVAPDQRP